jgi:hypothetical protein
VTVQLDAVSTEPLHPAAAALQAVVTEHDAVAARQRALSTGCGQI